MIINKKRYIYVNLLITFMLLFMILPVYGGSSIFAAEPYDQLTAQNVINIYSEYVQDEGTVQKGSFNDVDLYDVYVLERAGIDLEKWSYNGTSLKESVISIINNTIANEVNSPENAKYVAWQYLAAYSLGENGLEGQLLNILLSRQLDNADGTFFSGDYGEWTNLPVFDALAKRGTIGQTDVENGLTYILDLQDGENGSFSDFMTTAQAVRALFALKIYAGEREEQVQDAIDNGLTWMQSKIQEDGGFVDSFDDVLTDTVEAIVTMDFLGRGINSWRHDTSGNGPADYMRDSAQDTINSGNVDQNTWALEAYLALGADPTSSLGISISPDGADVAVEGTQQFTAQATLPDGGVSDVTNVAVWTVNNSELSSVNNGMFTRVAEGDVELTATYNGISDTVTVGTSEEPLAQVAVRIEGPEYTILPETTIAAPAGTGYAEILIAGADANGYTVEYSESEYGKLINSINEIAGDPYWMVTSYQGEGYQDGDSFVFSGNGSTNQGELSLPDPAEVTAGTEFSVTATFEGAPVEGATVIYYTSGERTSPQTAGVTDSNGELRFSIEEVGTYYVAAAKENIAEYPAPDNGLVRTAPQELTVNLSSAKQILATTIGSLRDGGVSIVPAGTKVAEFKNALTVSELASLEILEAVGGTAVTNQADTDLTAVMVIEVTAQDESKAEYPITVMQEASSSGGSVNATAEVSVIGIPDDISADLQINVTNDVSNPAIKLTVEGAGENQQATIQTNITVNVNTTLNGEHAEIGVTIPAGTEISGPAGWDGTLDLPSVRLNDSVEVEGGEASAVVEIGFGDEHLTLNKAIRLLIPGQAGKEAAYYSHEEMQYITRILSADNQATADMEIPEDGEAKIDVGSDLVIWTKHCTTFIAYTPLSDNAQLSSLTLSSGTLSPGFAPGTGNYTADVGNSVSSIQVTPTSIHPNATIKANEITVTSGQTSNNILLSVGVNTITVLVTAEDGLTTKTYTVLVNRAANSGGGQLGVTVSVKVIGKSGETLFGPQNVTLYATDTHGVTPVGALDKTGLSYSYDTIDYINIIAGQAPQGQNGWMYKVNGASPTIEAISYTLSPGDSVLWFYSTGSSNIAGVGGIKTIPFKTGDEIVRECIKNNEEILIQLAEKVGNNIPVSAQLIEELKDQNRMLRIANEGVQIDFTSQALFTEETANLVNDENGAIILGAAIVNSSDKNKIFNDGGVGESTGIFNIGGALYDFTAQYQHTNADGTTGYENIAAFTEPVKVTIDLSDKNLTEEEIAALCAIRYEKDADGNIYPVKLGGTYDHDAKTYTFYTEKFSYYTVMKVANLTKIRLGINKLTIYVNDKVSYTDVPPVIINDRTMVPLRFVAESFGADVEWIGAEETVEMRMDGRLLKLVIGKTGPGLDTPALIKDERTMVPIRYVAEHLGASVRWNGTTGTVEIVK